MNTPLPTTLADGCRLYAARSTTAPASAPAPVPVPMHNTCVVLGNFDGVHCGHQALMAHARAITQSIPLVALTFDPHPQHLFGLSPPRLLDEQDKAALLIRSGADQVRVMPFTRELATTPPEVFVSRVLMQGLGMRHLVVGHDFSLGKDRTGTADHLRTLGVALGFCLHQIPPCVIDNEVVSSTRIRTLLTEGAVEKAARLLGRCYSVHGTVVHGHQRGRTIGFPTANLAPPAVLLPKNGVYLTRVHVHGHAALPASLAPLIGVTNIGVNPTFGEQSVRVETHILDFSGDLYGATLRVDCVARLRDEERFASVEALRARIAADVATARALCKEYR